MKNNDALRVVLAELETAGAHIVSVCQRGHIKVRFEAGGLMQTVIVAASASDWRSTLNARAHIRQILRKE
jgi:hypothetical protein